MSLKTIRNIVLFAAFFILAFGAGYQVGVEKGTDRNFSDLSISSEKITGKTSEKISSLDFSLFWDVWDRLNKSYLDKKALNPEKMFYGAISGMVASLGDPYTVFLSPDQNKEAKDDLGGKFEGIGAQLGIKDKKIVVVAPLKDTPAEKAGLMPGDWIVKVDGKDTANWTLPEAVSKIRGPKGSKVVLTIVKKEASSSAEITVIRDSIKVASVEWEMLNVDCSHLLSECRIIKEVCPECYKVVYLKLIRFGDQTPEEWNKAVDEIILKTKEEEKKNKMKGLVFDLRNNPGGYLSGSVFIASEFLKDGVVVTQENASGIKQTYSVNRKGKFTEMPLVVLINKGTASSSEIVAGALQVRRGIKTVGETSFGKGSIQEAQDLEKGAGLHITTAKWLLPNGKWINGSGIEPDLKVENDPNKPDEDLQLIKGIEVLVK